MNSCLAWGSRHWRKELHQETDRDGQTANIFIGQDAILKR